MDKGQYQCLVGKLIYLSHTAFAVSVTSQSMHSPNEEHKRVVIRILQYLIRTPGNMLMFKKRDNMYVEAYTDADWTNNIDDRRSTSGYCTFKGEILVTSKRKKQNVVARSSVEAEFHAIEQGICELLWVKKISR